MGMKKVFLILISVVTVCLTACGNSQPKSTLEFIEGRLVTINEKEYVGRSAMTRYLLIVGINIPATNIKKRGISKLLHVNFFKYTFITGNNVYINTSIFVYQNDPNSFLFI